MVDFITLTCPNCSHKLQITKDIDRFACESCGNEHIVKRAGGIVSVAPVIVELKDVGRKVERVQRGVNKTASELAINRLEEEIEQLWLKHDSIKPLKFLETTGSVLFLLGLLGCFGYFTGAGGGSTSLGMLLLSIGVIILGVLLTQHQWNLESKARQPYATDIERKQSELAKHRKIVAID